MEPLEYLDLDLRIDRSADRYTANVLFSPHGEAKVEFALPFSDDRLELLVLRMGHARGGTRSMRSDEVDAARELGSKLFGAVFSNEVLACLRSSLDDAEQAGKGLRLKLHLQNVPELADLPWEFLLDPHLNRFFAQSNQTPIVRYIEIPERIRPLKTTLPLEILVMISSPEDYPALDVKKERSSLESALKPLTKTGKVRTTWLEDATMTSLQRELRSGSYHVLHYVGHGGFDKQSEEGVLVLEDEHQHSFMARADQLGTLLHDSRQLRLAVLNSCEGARNSRTDPFAGVATTLIRQGIPAVVAMQFEITDVAAITLASEFYSALADGFPVDAALAEARKAIFAIPDDLEWGTPVLYSRTPDGVLFDVQRLEDKTQLSPPPQTTPLTSVMSEPGQRTAVAPPKERLPPPRIKNRRMARPSAGPPPSQQQLTPENLCGVWEISAEATQVRCVFHPNGTYEQSGIDQGKEFTGSGFYNLDAARSMLLMRDYRTTFENPFTIEIKEATLFVANNPLTHETFTCRKIGIRPLAQE
jgi:hypothetical protein